MRKFRKVAPYVMVGLLGCQAGQASDATSQSDATSKTQNTPAMLCGSPVGEGGALFNVNSPYSLRAIHRDGDRALTYGFTNRGPHNATEGTYWLWDANTGTRILEGRGRAYGLAGGLAIIGTKQRIELRNAQDGTLVRTIDFPAEDPSPNQDTYAEGGLATDGSYVWLAGANGLRAWYLSGEPFITRAGANYQAAALGHAILALPGEIRVFDGPTGPRRTEFLVPGKESTFGAPLTEDNDSFAGWFVDGERIVVQRTWSETLVVYYVYSKDGTLVAEMPIENDNDKSKHDVGGKGDYFWSTTFDAGTLHVRIYTVGGSSAIATYDYPNPIETIRPPVAAIGDAIIVLGYDFIDTISLAGAPTLRDHVEVVPMTRNDGFAASGSAGRWCVSPGLGLSHCYDGTSQPPRQTSLGCGIMPIIDGSRTGNRVAATFRNGQTAVLDVSSTPKLLSVFRAPANDVRLSSDGEFVGVELARGIPRFDGRPDRIEGLGIFAAADGSRAAHWSDDGLKLFEISNMARRISRLSTKATPPQEVTDLAGNVLYRGDGIHPVHVSPQGTYFGVTSRTSSSPEYFTSIYNDQGVVAILPGHLATFIDEERVIMQYYDYRNNPPYTGRTAIYDLKGNLLAKNQGLPEFGPTTRLVDETRMATRQNVYDIWTGKSLASYPESAHSIVGQRRIESDVATGNIVLTEL